MAGLEPVIDVDVSDATSLGMLRDVYSKIHGFMAGHLAMAVDILREGLESSSLRILTFTGNLVATGLRGILAGLISRGLFNVVITTTGALDHDIARAMGGRYYRGLFEYNDVELLNEGYHRLGNVIIPVDSYGVKVEGFVRKLLGELSDGVYGIHELLRIAGRLINDEHSILRAAWGSGAYIFVPGWPDGAFGTALFTESQATGKRIIIDYFRDMSKLSELFFSRDGSASGLIIGGGISKHHAIWWSQFRGGLDYVVYITTAVEYDGSLSGAHPREAVSWGKIKPSARKVVIYGDATIILPILAGALYEAIDNIK